MDLKVGHWQATAQSWLNFREAVVDLLQALTPRHFAACLPKHFCLSFLHDHLLGF